MQLVADAEVVTTPGRFHALIIVEDTWTGDGRMFTAGSLTWRDLPFPLMAKDTDEHGSFGADTHSVLIGNFDTIERRGNELHGWGSYITAEPDSDADRLIGMIQRGELRGISADIDDVEFEVLFPVEPEPAEGETVDDAVDVFDDPVADQEREEVDGQEYIVLTMPEPLLRVTVGRIMGATVVPFPAFQEAFVEPDTEGSTAPAALAASGLAVLAKAHVHGAIVGDDAAPEPAPEPEKVVVNGVTYTTSTGMVATASSSGTVHVKVDGPREAPVSHWSFPAIPPADWFEVPETPGPMPLTMLDSGQVFGHLALWGECHVGFDGVCVEPPQSECSYARFHVGEIAVDSGGRVAVGRITFGTGHADRGLDAMTTQAHYDNTGKIGAYVVAMDGEHGIWCCGAMRAGLTDAEVQEFMAAPPSGDWRRFGSNLEMVGVLNVNVPGFNTMRASALVRREEGLVASLIVQNPAPPVDQAAMAAAAGQRAEAEARSAERIAATIGRTRAQRDADRRRDRIAAIAARVHGGN